jgi:hypothetical protein
MTNYGANTDPQEHSPADQSIDGRKVVAVRLGQHDDEKYDRVTFELSGSPAAPGFWVGYTDAAYRDGSGEVVEVPGGAVLTVSIRGIDWSNEAVDEYNGDSIDGNGEAIAGVRWDGSFEGTTQAFIGTRGRLPFRVGTLEDPARVYIDVAYGA